MTQFKGKVFKLYESRYGGGSFRLDDNPDYFNTNKSYPLPSFVQPGAVIEFEAGDLKGKGRGVVDNSIRQAASGASSGSVSAGSSGSRDESIRYQSARKDALVMVSLLITTGAIALPEKVAKKAEVIESAVDRFTALYFEDIDQLGALTRAEPEEIEPPVVTTKKTKTAPKPDPDDEELDD
jgi:hypothetical protein